MLPANSILAVLIVTCGVVLCQGETVYSGPAWLNGTVGGLDTAWGPDVSHYQVLLQGLVRTCTHHRFSKAFEGGYCADFFGFSQEGASSAKPFLPATQGVVDWTRVKAAGASFAFAKATEGTGYADSQFSANWAGMKVREPLLS